MALIISYRCGFSATHLPEITAESETKMQEKRKGTK